MVAPTFEEIPYHTIVECIAIHLGMKEFGAMSMMSTYLRDIFMSNDVWKRLYINSLKDKFKITDKSVHVGPCIENHKKRQPTEEMCPSSIDLWIHGSHWLPPYLTPWIFMRSLKGCDCVPKNSVRRISENAYGGVIRTQPLLNNLELQNAYKNARTHLCAAVIEDNQRHGHEHSHLCTNIDHYLIDTLDAPKSARNFKDYRRQTLSKFLTQTKHDPNTKKASSSAARKKKMYDIRLAELMKLKKEYHAEKAIVKKNKVLQDSLKTALNK